MEWRGNKSRRHVDACSTRMMHVEPWWCMQYHGGACMQYHAAHLAVTCSRTKWEKKEGREDLKRELGKRSVIEIFPYLEMKSMAQPQPSIPPFHKTESILDTQHYQKQFTYILHFPKLKYFFSVKTQYSWTWRHDICHTYIMVRISRSFWPL